MEESVFLVVAGDGPERRYLEKQVQELGEETRILFLGSYTREESKYIFHKANAFVLTSKVEPFGIVYIEAMQAGLPCIGTKGQGGEDIITEKSGILVDYGDTAALSDAMKTIRNNITTYKKPVIRDICRRNFSEESVCMQIEQIYRKLLKE